jgi:hypothetical protein
MKTKSNHRFIWYALALAGIAVLVFLFFPKSKSPAPPSEATAPVAEPATAVESSSHVTPALPAPNAVPLPEANLDEAQRAAIKAKILDLAAKEKDPLEYEGELTVMVKNYNLEQLKDLLELAATGSLDLVLAQNIRSVALDRWFQLDPAGAFKLAHSGLLAADTGYWLEEHLRQWAQSSSSAAFEFIRSNPLNGLPGDEAYTSLARGAAWGGSVDFVNQALAMESDPQQRLIAVASATQYLQQYHPDLTDAWIQGLPSAEQPRALAEAAKLQSKSDVPAALQKLGEIQNSNLNSTFLFGTTGSILAHWAEQDSAAAGDWLVGQMDAQKLGKFSEAQREMLLATLLRVWARNATSPEQITTWLEAQEKAGKLSEDFLNRAMKRF